MKPNIIKISNLQVSINSKHKKRPMKFNYKFHRSPIFINIIIHIFMIKLIHIKVCMLK